MTQGVLALALVQLAGMISPGPTAVLMVRNSARGGRSLGYAMALGITASSAVHIAASAAGLAELLLRTERLALVLRYAGALYLGYLGIRLLAARFLRRDPTPEAEMPDRARSEGSARSFREGFLINLLNPKVTILYLALFGQLAGAVASRETIYLLAGIFIAQSLGYWMLFAALTGGPSFRRQWARWSQVTEAVFGVGLLGFGLQLLISG
ncbi:MAG: LysE family translocator [Thermoanaerobaculia bacterium]